MCPVDDPHPATADQILDPIAEELSLDARVCGSRHAYPVRAEG